MSNENINIDNKLERLFDQIDQVRKAIPEHEVAILANNVSHLLEEFEELKADAKNIKDTIVNPPDGIAYKLERASAERQALISRLDDVEEAIDSIDTLQEGLTEVLRFKQNLLKLMWLLVGTGLAIALEMWISGFVAKLLQN